MVDFKVDLPYGAEYTVTPKGLNYLHYLVECREIGLLRQFIGWNGNVNEKNSFGLSPLYIACMSGCVEVVELLLRNGADPNVKPVPLHAAVKIGNINIIKLLCYWGADINAIDTSGHNALHIACTVATVNLTIVKFLLENKCFRQTEKVPSVLYFAIDRDDISLVKLLDSYNANEKYDNVQGMTPLIRACTTQASDEILSILLKSTTVTYSINNEQSPWYFLWFYHRCNIIEEALAMNPFLSFANVDEKATPICWAIDLNCEKCLKNVMKYGPNSSRAVVLSYHFPIELAFYYSPQKQYDSCCISYLQSHMSEYRLHLGLLLLTHGADSFELWNGLGWNAQPEKGLLPFKIAIRVYGFTNLNKIKMYSLLERIRNSEAIELIERAIFSHQYNSKLPQVTKTLREQCIICVRRHSRFNVLHTINNLDIPLAMKRWILLDPNEPILIKYIS